MPKYQRSELNSNYNIIWDKSWIVSEYESPWGVLEKFKFSNAATSKDIFDLFGSNDARSNKYAWLYKTYRNLYDIKGLDESRLIEYLGINLVKINQDNLKTIYKKLHFSDSVDNDYISKTLRICPECIKNGFHSYLHQLSILSKCPFHNINLLDRCPKCNREHIYDISDDGFQSAFNCVCDYFWGENEADYSFTFKWNKICVEKIKDDNLQLWLDTNCVLENKMKSVYFDNKIALTKGMKLIEYLNTVNDDEFSGLFEYKYEIKQSDKLPTFYNEIKYKAQNSVYRYDIEKDLVQIYKKIFRKIAKYVRKHLLKNHKYCINSYIHKKYIYKINAGEVCPYAYAYVMWRQSLENLDSFWQVHRRYKAKKYYTPGWNEQNLLYEVLIKIWLNYFNEFNSNNALALVLTYEKIISNLIINHYINWIKVVDSSIRKDESINPFYQLRKEDIPFYYLMFPDPTMGAVEIRYWISEKHNEYWSSEIDGFICPFKSARRRRKDKADLTHKAIKIPAIYTPSYFKK